LVERCGIALVLGQGKLQAKLPDSHVAFLTLEAMPSNAPAGNPDRRVGPDDPAYVMFTSGSTGRPKGVCIPHRGVVRLVKATRYADLDARQVFLQLAPLAFDASTFEIWGSLLNGACLVIAPPGRLDPRALGALIQKHGVTVLWLTAALFHRIVDDGIESLRPVKQLLAGGDVLSVPHVQRVLAELPDCTLINGYGPTENTTFTCCFSMRSGYEPGHSVPIGRPICNTRAYILDRFMQPVPMGVTGELCAAGAGLARGYLDEPELTAERFVEVNLFGRAERVYRTGDLARWNTDGILEFVGRTDHQVKIRGFRIEPGEIEAVLDEHPQVREAVVLVHEPAPGDKRLVAYLTLHRAGTTPQEFRDYLATRLPHYMVPSAFRIQEDLPLSPNGKLDRAALAQFPSVLERDLRSHFEPPVSPTERVLKNLWEALLQIEPIGRNQNFFELGGHSLLAAELMSHIEKLFGRRVPLDTLWFNDATIAGLAAALEAQPSAALPKVVDIKTGGSGIPLFCAPLIGGNLFEYYPLAQQLSPEWPVCGLQIRGLVAGETPRVTIPAIARDCIEAMRTRQPRGPYRLVGYSAGGAVAYEMARQILEEGDTVGMLALLDIYPEAWAYEFSSYARQARDLRQRFRESLRRVIRNPRSAAGAASLHQPLKESYLLALKFLCDDALRAYLRRMKWRAIHALGLSSVLAPTDLKKAHEYALLNYRYESIDQPFLLLYAKPPADVPPAALAWRTQTIKNYRAIRVPGDHYSMIREPHVSTLARTLRDAVEMMPDRGFRDPVESGPVENLRRSASNS
jgi:amino acid adenylation domain-containing protein